MRGIQKVRSLKIFNFCPPPPPCSSLFVLHISPPPTYVRFSELTLPLKKVPLPLWIFEWKIEDKKKEKITFFLKKKYFFCKLNINDQCFYTVIYTMTITIFIKKNKFIKKRWMKTHLYAGPSSKKHDYRQAIHQKNCLLFEKSDNFFHRVNLQIGLTRSPFVSVRFLKSPLHDERTFWMPPCVSFPILSLQILTFSVSSFDVFI